VFPCWFAISPVRVGSVGSNTVDEKGTIFTQTPKASKDFPPGKESAYNGKGHGIEKEGLAEMSKKEEKTQSTINHEEKGVRPKDPPPPPPQKPKETGNK